MSKKKNSTSKFLKEVWFLYPHAWHIPLSRSPFKNSSFDSILTQNPVRFASIRWLACIENQWFFKSNCFTIALDWYINTCCFPISTSSSPVRTTAFLIFPLSWCKEVPLWFLNTFIFCCIEQKENKICELIKKKFARF